MCSCCMLVAVSFARHRMINIILQKFICYKFTPYINLTPIPNPLSAILSFWFVRTLHQDNAIALFIFILTNCQNHWWIAFLTVRVNEYLSDLVIFYLWGKSLMLLGQREHAFWIKFLLSRRISMDHKQSQFLSFYLPTI